MLEIKNLSKIYTSKGNVITKALDDVSIKFPEKGMVFLLGKSGSGKSTLLNLCGGLDSPDTGEIIVKDRSSSTFSKSDFDSYRNTFIGFIFQEYNILNEFSVEDNISLALELQGKSKNKESIHNILKQVELENYAKRKPNTLSGGQKQRIAIARALIKDPEIIMADEPTGALDSTTGRQVLETLKELSKTKLVIVVSHDREFAEVYGDRIIELKDGKVLSDVSKEFKKPKEIGNVTQIDETTIAIKKGTTLGPKDIDILNSFIQDTKQEILIVKSDEEIKKYKKQARIQETGSREVFNQTNENNITLKSYTPEESKLIRSRLPIRHAAKIGLSSLKLKPVRLMFTIFLSVVSFILLGVVSTMMFYDKMEVATSSLESSSQPYINVQKTYKFQYVKSNGQSNNGYANFSDSDVERINNDYGNQTIFIYNFTNNTNIQSYENTVAYPVQNTKGSNSSTDFYNLMFTGFSYVNEENQVRNRITEGTYPQSNTEILISSYTANSILNKGIYDVSSYEDLTLTSHFDLIGKKILLSNKTFTISGVYNVDDLIDSKFTPETILQQNTSQEWVTELKNGLFTVGFVSEGFYDENISTFNQNLIDFPIYYTERPIALVQNNYSYNTLANVDDITAFAIDGTELPKNQSNCFVIDFYTFSNIISSDSDYYNLTSSYYQSTQIDIQPIINRISDGSYYDDDGNYISLTNEDYSNYLNEFYKFISTYDRLKSYLKLELRTDEDGTTSYDLAGFAVGRNITDRCQFFFSQDLLDKYYYSSDTEYYQTNYTFDWKAKYSRAFIYNTKDTSMIRSLVSEVYNYKEDDSGLQINSTAMSALDAVDSFIELGSQIFLWIGVILAIFSTLLLFNFISVSITNKKKEIGILRAVGARGIDVFKIFFSESLVIVFLCFVLSIAGSIATCMLMSSQLGKGLGGITLFVFGYKSILLIFALSLFVSFLSTFLPVFNIAKKKPVDSIRAL